MKPNVIKLCKNNCCPALVIENDEYYIVELSNKDVQKVKFSKEQLITLKNKIEEMLEEKN